MYTNVLRLARTINHQDERYEPPIPQVVFYQSGIGSEDNFYSEYIQGTTGASLASKVQEAYAFIAHNYQPGDEIFVFGFSRGAYTARMVAMFIGAIGVLDRTDMDHFAGVFIAFQKRGKSKDQSEIAELDKQLAPWTSHDSPGKKRADSDKDTFSVKCVGVFDTVGSLGLPDELKLHSDKVTTIFGFPDKLLGEHIQNAFQALALNETRKDFNCTKFQQSEGGRRKGQILKQCWFTGMWIRFYIGGGWHDHDLADLTLTWMAANISDLLSLDYTYLASLSDPVAPWGEQQPHDPRTGIYTISDAIQRQIPTAPDPVTHEVIHPSVLRQSRVLPALQDAITQYPELVCALQPLEEHLRTHWPYVPGKNPPKDVAAEHIETSSTKDKPSFLDKVVKKGSQLGIEAIRKATHSQAMATEGGDPVYEKTHLASAMQESHIGAFLREVVPSGANK
ncbi:hypothetical protein PLICRDRAFT_101450 [Plicaturopsis crispa FD-325 SS-3]|nr:hypothetical protein PLICRDRAFT_101450 [Plicaturopsis crispa FD-325 SS-3]